MHLITPSLEYIYSYVDAIKRGWLPDGTVDGAARTLAQIERDPESFLKHFDDPRGEAEPWRLPDGSLAPRVGWFGKWMWDGEFSGRIALRWPLDGTRLPDVFLGHIAYEVVPWKQRRGYATAALAEFLPEALNRGFRFVEIVTNIDNIASQLVIIANGGVLTERFQKLPVNGGGEAFRYRIDL